MKIVPDIQRLLLGIVGAIVLIFAMIMVLVIYQHNQLVHGCEYSKQNRDLPSMEGWTTAAARAHRNGDYDYEARYLRIADGFRRLVAKPCSERYRLLPF